MLYNCIHILDVIKISFSIMMAKQMVAVVLAATLLVSALGSPLGCNSNSCRRKKQLVLGALGLGELFAGLLAGTGETAALLAAGAATAAVLSESK